MREAIVNKEADYLDTALIFTVKNETFIKVTEMYDFDFALISKLASKQCLKYKVEVDDKDLLIIVYHI